MGEGVKGSIIIERVPGIKFDNVIACENNYN